MKHIFIFLFVLTFFPVFSQTLSPVVIASGGGEGNVAGTKFYYTVGETVITTVSNPTNSLTQGFHQPSYIISGLLDTERDLKGSFSVYPSPAIETIWYGFEFPKQGTVKVFLTDAIGRLVATLLTESNYVSGKTVNSFNCKDYAAGNYYVTAHFTTTSGEKNQLTKKIQIIN